jgi:hypothetical protein
VDVVKPLGDLEDSQVVALLDERRREIATLTQIAKERGVVIRAPGPDPEAQLRRAYLSTVRAALGVTEAAAKQTRADEYYNKVRANFLRERGLEELPDDVRADLTAAAEELTRPDEPSPNGG